MKPGGRVVLLQHSVLTSPSLRRLCMSQNIIKTNSFAA
jgi:hypothetical protein